MIFLGGKNAIDDDRVTNDTSLALLRSAEGVDPSFYRATYPDIGTSLDPIEHYAQHGWREGRSPTAAFSVEWYRKAHPDVGADVDPYLHFLTKGRRQGRRHAPHEHWRPEAWTSNHGGVDPGFYLARHRGDGSYIDAATHYTTQGWREGRDPNRSFSTQWYLAKNPDIAAAGIDPLHHYLASGMAEGRSPKPTVLEALRFHEWWSHKFSSFMAIVYATTVMLGLPILSMWPLLLAMLAALACAASYVSLINDWCDRAVDAAGNKSNRLMGRSPTTIVLLLAACIVPGAAFAWWWRHDPLVSMLYLATWLIFSLYSFPPFRLKYRGLLGPLCDATGAHVCPTLFLTVLVFRWAGVQVDWVWFTLAGSWALGYGLRGILYHQRLDVVHDVKAGMRTFVSDQSAERVWRLENALILPLEVAALSALLLRSGSVIAVLVFSACVAAECVRVQEHRRRSEGSDDASRHPILFGCYEVQVPLALLLTSALIDPSAVLVAVVHTCFFFRHRMRRVMRPRNRQWLPRRQARSGLPVTQRHMARS